MSFMAASLSGKWPRFLVIFRSWKLMDSMVIWSLLIKRGCDLGGCVEGSVFDAAA